MTAAQKIRQLMAERRVTGASLANAMSVPSSRVSELIHGARRLTLDQALSLSRLFGVSMEYLADDVMVHPHGLITEDERFTLQTVRVLGIREANRRLLLIPEPRGSTPPARRDFRKFHVHTKTYQRCVYFIEDRESLLIKIGRTSQIKARLKKLREEHPKAYVLATIPGHCKEERELHDLFSRYRVKGEWFRPSPLIFEYIAANAVGRN